MQVRSLDRESHLEEEMATHSSILPGIIPWTWGRIVRQYWSNSAHQVCNTRKDMDFCSFCSVLYLQVSRTAPSTGRMPNKNLLNRWMFPYLLFSSVAHSCLTLCNPMDYSMPGLPVHQQLLEFTQTHVHHISEDIQPSHPLSSPSPAFNLSQQQGILRIRWPKYWSFNFSINCSSEYSGLISFRIDWLDLLTVQGTLKSPPTPQFHSINSSAFSFLYGPTVTSIHDY